MMDAPKTWILSLAEPDEEAELEFEFAFQRSLTQTQRFGEVLLADYERRTGLEGIRDYSLDDPDLGVLAWLAATLADGGDRA